MIESQAEVVKPFTVADSRLLSDRGGATLTQMWSKFDEEKELYCTVKYVLKECCSDIVARMQVVADTSCSGFSR